MATLSGDVFIRLLMTPADDQPRDDPVAYHRPVDAREAARAWVDAWMGGWTGHDADVIASRYADECEFRSHPFREAVHGREGARQYALRAFTEERSARPSFGEPIVVPDGRAAIEYRAELTTTDREEVTLVGVTVLRFDGEGLVIEHRDYWAMEARR
jgi:hypothetical protein